MSGDSLRIKLCICRRVRPPPPARLTLRRQPACQTDASATGRGPKRAPIVAGRRVCPPPPARLTPRRQHAGQTAYLATGRGANCASDDSARVKLCIWRQRPRQTVSLATTSARFSPLAVAWGTVWLLGCRQMHSLALALSLHAVSAIRRAGDPSTPRPPGAPLGMTWWSPSRTSRLRMVFASLGWAGCLRHPSERNTVLKRLRRLPGPSQGSKYHSQTATPGSSPIPASQIAFSRDTERCWRARVSTGGNLPRSQLRSSGASFS